MTQKRVKLMILMIPPKHLTREIENENVIRIAAYLVTQYLATQYLATQYLATRYLTAPYLAASVPHRLRTSLPPYGDRIDIVSSSSLCSIIQFLLQSARVQEYTISRNVSYSFTTFSSSRTRLRPASKRSGKSPLRHI